MCERCVESMRELEGAGTAAAEAIRDAGYEHAMVVVGSGGRFCCVTDLRNQTRLGLLVTLVAEALQTDFGVDPALTARELSATLSSLAGVTVGPGPN